MSALAAAWSALLLAWLLTRTRGARLPVPPVAAAPVGRRRHRLPPSPWRARAQRRAAVAAAAPDLVDLVAVGVAAGLNVRLTVMAVTPRLPPGPLRDELTAVLHAVAGGTRLADALEALPGRLEHGRGPPDETVRALTAALVDGQRYGTPLGPTLDRLAVEARRSRQRRAEERARRVPVLLLFPLVTCILPAFGLLTVAPLIAGGLRALRL